jgi:uncharacterized damage-inducible protein DinB
MLKNVAILLCACAPFAVAADGAMTAAERAYLLDQLEATRKTVLATLQNVSPAQWAFKPAPAVWSVQECAEHIVLAEDFLLSTTQNILKTPTVARLASANAEADKQFFAFIQDRSKKATAPEAIRPDGQKFATPADAIKEFTARRAKTVAYVKDTNDELRLHVMPGPIGNMDAYQFLLLLASHSARHSAQIREVQANPGYPKS